jgi:hypothetical protein
LFLLALLFNRRKMALEKMPFTLRFGLSSLRYLLGRKALFTRLGASTEIGKIGYSYSLDAKLN